MTRDTAALVKAVVRNPGETTPVAMLADALQEQGDPAHLVLTRHLSQSPPTRASRGRDPYPEPPGVRHSATDRGSLAPGESVKVVHRLAAYEDVDNGGDGMWQAPGDPAFGDPYPLLQLTLAHTEPPPPRKIWNHSRSRSRTFQVRLTHAEARDFLDAHPDAKFRRAGHRYLDRHFGPDPRGPERLARSLNAAPRPGDRA